MSSYKQFVTPERIKEKVFISSFFLANAMEFGFIGQKEGKSLISLSCYKSNIRLKPLTITGIILSIGAVCDELCIGSNNDSRLKL